MKASYQAILRDKSGLHLFASKELISNHGHHDLSLQDYINGARDI